MTYNNGLHRPTICTVLLQVLVEPTGHMKRTVRTVSVPVMEYSFHRGGLDGQDTQMFFELLLLAWTGVQVRAA